MALIKIQTSADLTNWSDASYRSAETGAYICGVQLNFYPNGGTWSDGTTSCISSVLYVPSVWSGYYVRRTANKPKNLSYTGYSFSGWKLGSASSTNVIADGGYVQYSSILSRYATVIYDVYANWTSSPTPSTTTVRINYDANGGAFVSSFGGGTTCYSQGTVSSLSDYTESATFTAGYHDSGIFITGQRVQYSGYAFKGWVCKGNDRRIYSNSPCNNYPSTTSNIYTIEVKAEWEIDADTWETAYANYPNTISSGNLEYDDGCGKIYWKLLVTELGADYINNTSDIYFDFRAYSVLWAGKTFDSRPYNKLYLTINSSSPDTGSSKYALNYQTFSDEKYINSETGCNLMSQFATSQSSNQGSAQKYISLIAEKNELIVDLFGSCGTNDGTKNKNIQWPHIISSSSSTNGLGYITASIYYNRPAGAYEPTNFTINSTTNVLTLTKFDRSIAYSLNGGSGTTPSTQEKQFGTALTLASASGITKTGCTFAHWKCTATSSSNELTNEAKGTTYSSGASFSDDSADGVLGGLTLVAQWTPTVTVSLSGNTVVGQTLTASVSTVSSGTKSYQWFRTNGSTSTDISGATSSSYVLTSSDAGYYVGCKVTVAATDDGSYLAGTGTAQTSSTISEKTAVAYTTTAYSGTYDGNMHYATITVTSNDWDGQLIVSGETTDYGSTVTSSGSYGTAYNLLPGKSAASTTTIYFKITGGTYHSDTTGSTTITISKASSSWSTTPSAITGLTYTGLAQTLCTAGSGTGITPQYKLSDGTYSTTPPTATNAETYTVYYKGVGDTNHEDIPEASFNVEIAKAESTYDTEPRVNSLTYNGSAQELCNAGATSCGTIQYNDSTSVPTQTNAGSYIVSCKIVGDSNHNDYSGPTLTCTINKASSSYTQTPEVGTGLVYNESAQKLLSKEAVATFGTVQYKIGSGTYSTTSPTATNAGTYTIYYYVPGTDNYNGIAETSTTCTIAKANSSVSCSVITSPEKAQGQSITIATATGTHCTVKLGIGASSSSAPSTWQDSPLTVSSAGTYYVWSKGIAESTNYNDTAQAYQGVVTIENASWTITYSVGDATSGTAPATQTYTYTGSAVTISGNTGNLQKANSTPVTGYTVTFDSQGETDPEPQTNTRWNTYKFNTWTDGTTQYVPGTSYSSKANLALNPAWTSTEEVSAVILPDVGKYGYRTDWYLGEECVGQAGWSYVSKANITLTAKYVSLSNVRVYIEGEWKLAQLKYFDGTQWRNASAKTYQDGQWK